MSHSETDGEHESPVGSLRPYWSLSLQERTNWSLTSPNYHHQNPNPRPTTIRSNRGVTRIESYNYSLIWSDNVFDNFNNFYINYNDSDNYIAVNYYKMKADIAFNNDFKMKEDNLSRPILSEGGQCETTSSPILRMRISTPTLKSMVSETRLNGCYYNITDFKEKDILEDYLVKRRTA